MQETNKKQIASRITSEVSVHTTLHCMGEENTIHSHDCENLISSSMLETCWKDGKCTYIRNVLNDDPEKRQIYNIYDRMVKPVL